MKTWVSNATTSLKIVFFTKRGLKKLLVSSFAFFGFVSVFIQFIASVFQGGIPFNQPYWLIYGTSIGSLLFGLLQSIPKSKINHTYKDIDVKLNVVIGDMLKQKGQIVIGFSDTFDTDTTGDAIISSTSLQGKLLQESFKGDVEHLDTLLKNSLQGADKAEKELRKDKAHGKLQRYPIGTVAVIKAGSYDHIYAVAIGRMGNDLVNESSVYNLWDALGQLWESVYVHGQRKPISMPLLGTKLSRINALDRESILRMIILSFMARSREKLVCNELTVYIHPSDRHHINMLELEAFIKTI